MKKSRMQGLFGRKLRVEPLERRVLLASNVLDTSAEVTDFSSGHVYISGVIESSETRDVFKVSLGSNPTIAIFSGNAYLNESIKLELIDANGNTIQHLEDGSSPAHYYFDALAKGDYFFVVTSDAVDDVEYELTLNEYRSSVDGGTPDPETRPDDADEIGPNATELVLTDATGEMDGTLEFKGDVDVFRFTVGEFHHLDFRGLRIDGGEALTVRLFFGDGRYWNFVVEENSQVLADPRELVGSHFQHLPAGEYFVVVSGGDSQAVDYRISITAYNFPIYEPGEVVMVAVDDSGEKIDTLIRPLSQSLENDPAKVPMVDDDLNSVGITHSENKGLAEERVAVGLDDETLRTKENWHNESSPADVNADGRKTPLDVLLIIEWLNERGVSSVAASTSVFDSRTTPSNKRPSFLDVSGNGKIEPMDALLAINELNREADLKQRAEGESASEFAVNVDWIFSKHDDD